MMLLIKCCMIDRNTAIMTRRAATRLLPTFLTNNVRCRFPTPALTLLSVFSSCVVFIPTSKSFEFLCIFDFFCDTYFYACVD